MNLPKTIFRSLWEIGKLETCIDIYNSYLTDPILAGLLMKGVFYNRARGKVLNFINDKKIEIESLDNPVLMRNIIALAEETGSLSIMSEWLTALDSKFKHYHENSYLLFTDEQKIQFCKVALNTFMLDHAENIIDSITDHDKKIYMLNIINRYNSICSSEDFDNRELQASINIMRENSFCDLLHIRRLHFRRNFGILNFIFGKPIIGEIQFL